ncbi:hypothetical protein PIB30_100280, partial [Stylosanthes scabra]|nr:hypothetical protein [Stylosanthes scabra]
MRGRVTPDHAYAYAWDSHPLATDQHPTHTTTQTNTLRTQLHRPTPYALLHMVQLHPLTQPSLTTHAYAYAWDSHPLATDQHPTHTTTQTNTLRTQLYRPTPYALPFPHPSTHMRAILRICVGTISAHKGSLRIDLFY